MSQCRLMSESDLEVRYKLHYRKAEVENEEIQSRGSFRAVVFILQEIRN